MAQDSDRSNQIPPAEHRLKEQLTRTIREAEDPLVRAHAALMLGRLGDPGSVPDIVALFNDTEKAVRAAAARAVAMIGEQAIPSLAGLLGTPVWTVRYRAAEALGFIGLPAVKQPLIGALKDGKDHVRYMAVKGLRALCDREVIREIFPLLEDGNEYVRKSVVIAIAGCGDPGAPELLRGQLEKESSPAVRAEILKLLGET
jgi:HEAT repeat protein